MDIKTNVMRLIEQAKIPYNHYCYVNANTTNGEEIAAILGQDPNRVFKTLVTRKNTNAISGQSPVMKGKGTLYAENERKAPHSRPRPCHARHEPGRLFRQRRR